MNNDEILKRHYNKENCELYSVVFCNSILALVMLVYLYWFLLIKKPPSRKLSKLKRTQSHSDRRVQYCLFRATMVTN